MAPLPPKTTLPLGTSVGLDELAVRVNDPAGVSRSPTVKGTAAVAVFSIVLWLAMAEIVGG